MLCGALILSAAAAVQTAAAQPGHDEQLVASMLADQWIRLARAVVESEPLTIPKIRAATVLAQQSTTIAPTHLPAWRFQLALADLGENRELQVTSVEQIARLDPADEPIRLRRISHEIDKRSTAEERVAMYEQLLAPQRRSEIGDAVASRLAFDLALLKQAQGDMEGFSTWLADASAMDPSNRKAAAQAAGFFRANVEDPVAEAELLVSLAMADPTDALSMLTLAQLLLEHGAFDGANRMYQQALKVALRTGVPAVTDELVADAAIAQWGRGDATGAQRMILEHQRMMDLVMRNRARMEQQNISPLELAKITATLAPTLSSVRAIIQKSLGGELATTTMHAAIASYDKAIADVAGGETPNPDMQARLLLEQASIMLWLGADTGEVMSRVQQAADLHPLTTQAQARFEGWLHLRRGELDEARAMFEPLAADDSMAALGLALALIEQGDRKESARQLLSVVRRQPGTLLGVLAYNTLADMLKQRFSVSQTAAQLDQLVGTIPAVFDRYVDDPSLVLSMRVIPSKLVFAPFEPVLVELELTNHSSVPLAIDRDGPIRPHVALISSPQVARTQLPPELPPYILDIDRKLRLMPRERLRITVDLRQTQLATVLDSNALRGATITVRALLNFMVTPQGVLRPGVLGSELQTDRLRIDGVRTSRAWLEDVIADLTEPDSLNDLVQMALLAPVVAAGPAAGSPPEDRQLLLDAATVFVDAFPKLPPTSQAWLLCVLPKTPNMDPIRAIARRSAEPAVQLSYMLHQSTGASDPIFDAVRRSEHPGLSELAELFINVLQPEQEAQLNSGSESPSK